MDKYVVGLMIFVVLSLVGYGLDRLRYGMETLAQPEPDDSVNAWDTGPEINPADGHRIPRQDMRAVAQRKPVAVAEPKPARAISAKKPITEKTLVRGRGQIGWHLIDGPCYHERYPISLDEVISGVATTRSGKDEPAPFCTYCLTSLVDIDGQRVLHRNHPNYREWLKRTVQQGDVLATYIQAGLITPNEARAHFDTWTNESPPIPMRTETRER